MLFHHDHGCDDADIASPSGRYLNQPGKGPSFHTDEFMDGYREGFHECNDKGYEISTEMNELPEGQYFGTCEESNRGMACDIEEVTPHQSHEVRWIAKARSMVNS